MEQTDIMDPTTSTCDVINMDGTTRDTQLEATILAETYSDLCDAMEVYLSSGGTLENLMHAAIYASARAKDSN